MNENDIVFSALSKAGHNQLVQGKLYAYADILKAKAILLDAEGKYIDMLKVLMLAFYIYASGDGGRCLIDSSVVRMVVSAADKAKICRDDFEALYYDTVDRSTTRMHRYGVKKTLHILIRSIKRSGMCLQNDKQVIGKNM